MANALELRSGGQRLLTESVPLFGVRVQNPPISRNQRSAKRIHELPGHPVSYGSSDTYALMEEFIHLLRIRTPCWLELARRVLRPIGL